MILRLSRSWTLKLVIQLQNTLFFLLPHPSGASFQVHTASRIMKRRRHSLEYCPFWATVAGKHGGSVDVDPAPCG